MFLKETEDLTTSLAGKRVILFDSVETRGSNCDGDALMMTEMEDKVKSLGGKIVDKIVIYADNFSGWAIDQVEFTNIFLRYDDWDILIYSKNSNIYNSIINRHKNASDFYNTLLSNSNRQMYRYDDIYLRPFENKDGSINYEVFKGKEQVFIHTKNFKQIYNKNKDDFTVFTIDGIEMYLNTKHLVLFHEWRSRKLVEHRHLNLNQLSKMVDDETNRLRGCELNLHRMFAKLKKEALVDPLDRYTKYSQ